MRIILLGPPGVGKGTQAGLICKAFDIPWISTGEMFREAVASRTALGLKVQEVMKAGSLVSDDIVIQLVLERIARQDCQRGFVLDGFPRTLPQAKELANADVDINYVIQLKLDDQTIVRRMGARLYHPQSGRTYNKNSNPPKVAGRDDVTGAQLITRDDDHEETVRKRLNIYRQQTAPLVAYYKAQAQLDDNHQLKYIAIPGDADVVAVNQDIMSQLAN